MTTIMSQDLSSPSAANLFLQAYKEILLQADTKIYCRLKTGLEPWLKCWRSYRCTSNCGNQHRADQHFGGNLIREMQRRNE